MSDLSLLSTVTFYRIPGGREIGKSAQGTNQIAAETFNDFAASLVSSESLILSTPERLFSDGKLKMHSEHDNLVKPERNISRFKDNEKVSEREEESEERGEKGSEESIRERSALHSRKSKVDD